jgi:hypothetical protein
MKLIIVLLAAIIIALGCNRDQKSSQSEEQKKDSSKLSQQNNLQVNAQGNGSSGESNSSGIKNIEFGISKLSRSIIDYEGTIVAMAKWDDKMGSNVLLVTETEMKGGEFRHKELYGYHYITTNDEYKLIWKINDFVKDCPVDLTLNYIDKSISITDLDNNGIAESSFLYRMSCKGDVSPDDMKLIMHEGEAKYAIRGSMKLQIGNEKPIGGEMKPDAAFDKAPKEFLSYAKEQWNKYVNEKIEVN